MNNQELKEKIKKHLLLTVGNKPSAEEIKLVGAGIQKGYDKIYDGFDKEESLIAKVYTKDLSKYWIRVVANEDLIHEFLSLKENVNIKSDYNIASFASGLAVFEIFLAKELVPHGFVSCFDISDGMNKIAREYVNKLNQKNIKIVTSSVLSIPLENDSQDLVIARRTGLSKDKRWINVLKEAYRILKKQESSNFIYTVDKEYNDSLDKIKSSLEKADLRFIEMKESHSSNNGPVCMILAKPLLN